MEKRLGELAEAVRTEAIMTFFADEYTHWQNGFGTNHSLRNKQLAVNLAASDRNFSLLDRLMMPGQAIRLATWRPRDDERDNRGHLIVVHYRISPSNASLLPEVEDRQEPKLPDGFGPKSFGERLNGLEDISCIATNVWSHSEMIGRRATMQHVINFYKENPHNFPDLMQAVFRDTLTLQINPADMRKISIYDLVSKPRKVHFELPNPNTNLPTS